MIQFERLPERSTLTDDEENASNVDPPIQLMNFWKSFIPSDFADQFLLFEQPSPSIINELLKRKHLNLINRYCSCKVKIRFSNDHLIVH